MRIQQSRRSNTPALAASVQLAMAMLTLLALLQLLLLQKRLTLYLKMRHSITMWNRAVRTLLGLLPVFEKRYDVMTRWMHASQHPVAFVLAGYALFAPVLQVQVRML
jgi:membrane-associated HD superfamily phosphohydrolase